MGGIIKGFMVAFGLLIFVMNLRALARRKMYPTFSVAWSVIAVVLIALGAFLRLDQLQRYMSWKAVALLVLGGVFILGSVYVSSLQISSLMSRNQELTMQVALLNEEISHLRGDGNDVPGSKKQK